MTVTLDERRGEVFSASSRNAWMIESTLEAKSFPLEFTLTLNISTPSKESTPNRALFVAASDARPTQIKESVPLSSR